MSGPSQVFDSPSSELQRRRDELAEQVAELHWNLGGLAYEMAIRDHFRLDVLVRRAAMLQERDAELAETERLLRMQESAVAGSCASCGAVRSRGAVFCWLCGAKVMEHAEPLPGAAGMSPAATGHGNGARESSAAVQAPVLIPLAGRSGDETSSLCSSSEELATSDEGEKELATSDEGEKALGRPMQATR
jgi:hypothetical protein